VAILGMKALDELVQIGAFERSLFQSEVLIAQVVNPKFLNPRSDSIVSNPPGFDSTIRPSTISVLF
jgi:hypothetical protein